VPKKLKLTRAETDFDQNGWAIRGIVPGSNLGADKRSKGLQRGWAIGGNEPENRVPRKAVFAFEPFSVPAGSTVTVRLIHGSPYAKHAIGRFSLSYTGAPNSMLGVGGFSLPGALQGTLLADVSKRTPQQAAQLTKYFRENGEHPLKALKARVDAARKVIEDFEDQFASTMIFKELDKPRDAFLLKRGEYDKPGERVERALPAFLPKLPEGAPNNRLGLARWLVSGEHPLTARVWVNREPRIPSGMAEQFGIARLACNGVCSGKMGYESDASPHGDQRRLQTVFKSPANPSGEGSRESLHGARLPFPVAG
jgi:hypothetical protein